MQDVKRYLKNGVDPNKEQNDVSFVLIISRVGSWI